MVSKPDVTDISKHKKMVISIVLVILMVSGGLFFLFSRSPDRIETISIREVLELTSERRDTEDVVIVSDSDPFYSVITAPVACWYDIAPGDGDPYGLRPLLIAADGKLDGTQERFLSNYGADSFLLVGEVEKDGRRLTGPATEISLKLSKKEFERTSGVLIVPDTEEGYELGVVAAPLASYLNIPVLIVNASTDLGELRRELVGLGTEYCAVVGPDPGSIAKELGFKAILLENREAIMESVLVAIKNRFGEINYITMTNPSDVIPPYVTSSGTDTFETKVENIKIETGRAGGDILGESSQTYDIHVPSDLNLLRIHINFTSVSAGPLTSIKDAVDIEPLIFASLYDPDGDIVAYGPSFSLDVGKTYLETLSVDAPGTYRLKVDVYYGTAGFDTYAGTGFGISKIDAAYQVTVVRDSLSSPHYPLYPRTSMLAPYLTAAHGGLVLADPEFELTGPDYARKAKGHSTGPWYDKELHDLANEKVERNVNELNGTMELLKEHGLYEDYLNGSAWLAILGGANMIPMYYEPKESDWVEDPLYGTGWATDLRYGLGSKLSWARPLGRDVGDVSSLIVRTLFYEEYALGRSAARTA